VRFSHLSTTPDSTPRLAAVVADGAYFLDELLAEAPRDLQDLIERGDAALGEVRAFVGQAVAAGVPTVPVHELRHASAVLRPPQVIAIGANYAAHASELRLRSEKAATVFSL
jgi:2-keto-4-pentenoate hydratase/2-oxohepta-3-ene-1,7-dioic acid hydratase in catechol pathway